jgi:signal transduction histidine kinase
MIRVAPGAQGMKILHKLMLGYLMAGLLIAIAGFLSARAAQLSLERHISELSADVAAQLLDRVLLDVRSTVELFRAYSHSALLCDTLAESNRRYAAVPDPEAYIDLVDAQWLAGGGGPAAAEALKELQGTPLSREFEHMVRFLARERGFGIVGEMFATNIYGANAAESGRTTDFRQNDEEWWKRAMADGLYLGPVSFDESAAIYSIEIGLRVTDRERRPLGVMKVVVSIEAVRLALEEAFERDIAEKRHPEFWCLLGPQAQVILPREGLEDRAALLANLPVAMPAGVLEGRPGTGGGAFAVTAEDGRKLVCAYASSLPRHEQGVPRWILLAAYDRAVLHAPITRLTLQIGGLSLLVVIIGITVGWLMSRSICVRIERLRRGAEEIGGGNLDHSVAMAETDEIGELAGAFDAMAANLQQTMASRDELNAEVGRREEVEKRLRDTLAELSRSNEELQQFAYVASHDLQEPLRKIRAFGDRLQTVCGEALPEKGADYLARMQNAARRMTALIEDLLTLSRVATSARPFEPVDMNQALRDVLGDLELRIQETGAQIEAGDLPGIEADPVQMRQLLQNLVSNALKFHREGEPPVVRIAAEMVEGPQGEEAMRMTVSDSGIGFEGKFAERIFGVFQRLHARDDFPGTGIGLAVCRKIAERHGGTISASSAPGEGTTFTVTLPAHQPERGNDQWSA